MKVSVKENNTAGRLLELIADTEQDVEYLEEIVGEQIERFDKATGSILAIALVPFSSFKNKVES